MCGHGWFIQISCMHNAKGKLQMKTKRNKSRWAIECLWPYHQNRMIVRFEYGSSLEKFWYGGVLLSIIILCSENYFKFKYTIK